jgi:two-component system, LytTR family, response regulator
VSFTTVIADDEKVARDGLRLRLKRHADVEVVGECRNGLEVVDMIGSLKPDLLFLDVQMPGLSGFDALARLDPGLWPAVVFVTAFEQHALRAFDVNAIDYLLKPYDEERFERALQRALEELRLHRREQPSEVVQKLIGAKAGEPVEPCRFLQHLLVRERERAYFVRVEDIEWIESARNYVRLHTADGRHVVRWTISELAQRLDRSSFAQIHRATIVNINRIREIRAEGLGCSIIMRDGTRLYTSRHYRRQLMRDV